MAPDPDPEQRIDDLERSLSAPQTGVATPAPEVGTGIRLGWIVLGLLIVGLVVSGGLMVTDRLNRPVAGRPTSPVTGGTGQDVTSGFPRGAPVPPASAPSAAPTSVPPPVGTPRASAAPDAPISVAGLDTRKTIACTDNMVTISGVSNTVVLTGRCGRVDVSGIENVVTVEEAGAIVVSGLNNRVTFRSGTPELSKSGIGNTLERG
jgi:hypothetical protein